jgi:hypothetical protein
VLVSIESAEEVWALPDKLTMHKRDDYKHQKEYRLAFSIQTSVFDYENVECFLVNKETRWPRAWLNEHAHRINVRVGTLEDCCRIA